MSPQVNAQLLQGHRQIAHTESAVAAAIQTIGAFVRRVHAAHQRRQEAKSVYDALREMDDRTLRDLGFHRSEITSFALEALGVEVSARARALWTSQGPAR